MDRLLKQNELAKEAVKLIKEFRKVQLSISEDIFSSVRKNKSGSKIIIDDIYDGKLEYDLIEVSKSIATEINGWGPCHSGFYEAIEMAKGEAESYYKEGGKASLSKYIGNIYYIEFRCEEIFKRLKEIDKEAKELSI